MWLFRFVSILLKWSHKFCWTFSSRKLQKYCFPGLFNSACTRASILKSSFYSYFHKLCSGADKTAFYNFRDKLQHHWLPQLFIWFTPEHHFWSRHVMSAFTSCALVLTRSHFKNYSFTLPQHDIAVLLCQQKIILSVHRLLCQVAVGPPIAYLRIGGPNTHRCKWCFHGECPVAITLHQVLLPSQSVFHEV